MTRTPSRARRRRLAARVAEARRNQRRRDRVQLEDTRADRLEQRIARLKQSLKVAERALDRRAGTEREERHADLRERLAAARERRERRERIAARRPPSRRPRSRVAGRYVRAERPAPRREAQPQERQAEVIRRKSTGEILIREDVPPRRQRQIYAELRKAGLI